MKTDFLHKAQQSVDSSLFLGRSTINLNMGKPVWIYADSTVQYRTGIEAMLQNEDLKEKIGAVYHISFPVIGRASFGIFGSLWSVLNRGIGQVLYQSTPLPTTASSVRGWAWISAIMSCISSFVSMIVNNSDYTRFATRPSIIFWPQMITIPLGFSITSFIGLIVGSSSKVIYGKEIWNSLELLNIFLDNTPSSATRAGVFSISLSFRLAQLGVNIAANSISVGCDLTAICPKYLNMRRSGYICSIVGLCICPWQLLSSSSSFIFYLSAYSTFVSASAGVMFADYYFVRREHLDMNKLYSASSEGLYYYTFGINWRAYIAYIAGILINVVGFAGAVGAHVPSTVTKMTSVLGIMAKSVHKTRMHTEEIKNNIALLQVAIADSE
ncbi:unnamed protein product [Rotaria sp. Silwood2]|nr:unnamed protein product [Rotaria sp. Silwood2]